jgi:hypothetical protein
MVQRSFDLAEAGRLDRWNVSNREGCGHSRSRLIQDAAIQTHSSPLRPRMTTAESFLEMTWNSSVIDFVLLLRAFHAQVVSTSLQSRRGPLCTPELVAQEHCLYRHLQSLRVKEEAFNPK